MVADVLSMLGGLRGQFVPCQVIHGHASPTHPRSALAWDELVNVVTDYYLAWNELTPKTAIYVSHLRKCKYVYTHSQQHITK